ncbi:hypothetical protein HOM83_01460 [Candidatus Falkowbacteria bacterium]|nr:hypothetical protein [Candidatus Falkowbacteria bacterium]
MLTLEQNLTEKSLHANFTEVQQAHFDRLMSELEVISDGLGFAELKAKAEAGSKEALQVMRDYVAKKEQIVQFIETKEVPEVLQEKNLKIGDRVVVKEVERDHRTGKLKNHYHDGGVVESFPEPETVRVRYNIGGGVGIKIPKSENCMRLTGEMIDNGAVEYEILDFREVDGIKIGQNMVTDLTFKTILPKGVLIENFLYREGALFVRFRDNNNKTHIVWEIGVVKKQLRDL